MMNTIHVLFVLSKWRIFFFAGLFFTITSCLGEPTVGDCAWSMCSHSAFQENTEFKPSTFRVEFYQCDLGQRVLKICWSENDDLRRFASRVSHFSLTKVSLSYFPIRDLCQFGNVQHINLERNSISYFAYPGDHCLVKTKGLNLRENLLQHVNLTEFLRLPNLEELNLDDNLISELYVSVIPFHTMLRHLTARRNRIHTIDISIIRIITLSIIDVSANEIRKVSNRLRWNWKERADSIGIQRSRLIRPDNTYAKDLTIIIKSNNFSDSFSNNMLWGVAVGDMRVYQNIESTRNLRESEGAIQVLYKYKRAFDFLKIQAEGSSVACNCHAYDAYLFFKSHLDLTLQNRLGLQGLKYWLDLPCNFPPKVTGFKLLNLAANDLICLIHHHCPKGCTCEEHVHPEFITKINCTNAQLQRMPRHLPKTQLLNPYDVDLTDNQISELHLLPFARDIRRLVLKNNFLNEFADFRILRHFVHLQLLDLRRNQLHKIPPSLLQLTQELTVPEILLDGNPFRCDCDDIFSKLQINLFQIFIQLHCFDNKDVRVTFSEYRHLSCKSTSRHTQQQTISRNQTKVSLKEHVNTSSHSQWMLISVAIMSGLLITSLFLTTGIILCRYVLHNPTQTQPCLNYQPRCLVRTCSFTKDNPLYQNSIAVNTRGNKRDFSVENLYVQTLHTDCSAPLLLSCSGCGDECNSESGHQCQVHSQLNMSHNDVHRQFAPDLVACYRMKHFESRHEQSSEFIMETHFSNKDCHANLQDNTNCSFQLSSFDLQHACTDSDDVMLFNESEMENDEKTQGDINAHNASLETTALTQNCTLINNLPFMYEQDEDTEAVSCVLNNYAECNCTTQL